MSDPGGSGANLVAFRIPAELMARAGAAVEAVRKHPADPASVGALVEVILELTERGMDFYYLEPLRRAEAGTVARSATRIGIAAATSSLPRIVRRVIASLDEEQLLSIAGFIDEILVRGDGETGG